MAYERKTEKVKGDSLDAFVNNLAATFSTQIKLRNADDEFKFNTAVINDGLSLDDQLAYRKEQLKRVSDDPAERTRIRGEITGLKQRIEQKKFSDSYLEKLISHESGLSSIDSVISFLTDQKSTATDQTIIDQINTALVTKNQEKYTLTSKLIGDQTEYAVKDKSVEVLDTQIGKVTAEKNKALLAGNDGQVANLNLQLQSLNKAKTELSIERDIKNFAASNITGYATATKLLDAYNSKISSAANNTPITIGDVTYSSAKEFWTYKRDSYISDQSSSGLFGRLSTEVGDKIKTSSSKNALDVQTLQKYTKDVSSLAGRPELAGYESKIDATKQDLLQDGANLLSDKISNTYATDYDLNKAVGALNGLKAIGVNTDEAYAKIIIAGANVKTSQINNILSAAQNALANDPNMKPEDAIAAAIAGGASVVKSPNELATTDEKSLSKDLTKTATDNKGQVDPKLTVAPENVTPTTNTPTPTTPPGNAGFKTITVNPGENLSTIAQRELGSASKFNEIATLNGITDPNKIKSGQVLKIPVKAPAATPTPTVNAPKTTTPVSKPTTTPAPAPTPAPKPVVTATPPPPSIPVTHKIKAGDTLSKIAAQYGTSVASIASLNNIKDPNKIVAGVTIKVK